MKLRNKKTGEIAEAVPLSVGVGPFGKWYDTLKEFNEEWEDYEEPKEYWIPMSDEPYPFVGNDWEKEGLATGLISLSKEENDRKRQKLKAWKRVKDGGLRFNGYSRYDWDGNEDPSIVFEYSDFNKMFDDKQVVADLDLLFSGEDD